MLDYLVHAQFGFENDFDINHLRTKQLPLVSVLFIFIYITLSLKGYAIGQFAFAAGAFFAGSTFVHAAVNVETVSDFNGSLAPCCKLPVWL